MSDRSWFCNYSFLAKLYILSRRCPSRQPCDQFENQCFFGCPCEQSGKFELRRVGFLRARAQTFLRLSEACARVWLYLLLKYLTGLPCGLSIRQQIAECRNLFRRIRNSLRKSISLVTVADQYYLSSTYASSSCEEPVRLKLFIRICLFYLSLIYPGHPCEQLARSEPFIKTHPMTTIHSLLREAVPIGFFVSCETLKPFCLKRTFSTSWDRAVFNIATKDLSCTGILYNTS